ncbi:hypothetical protein [Candidatus Electronema sp. PJ]
MEGFYNRQRRHSAISYQSPDNYERLLLQKGYLGNKTCPLVRRQVSP